MGMQERFNEFISYKRMSKRKFQLSIGVSNSYIQNIVNNISEDVLNRISKIYPELNTDWLLTGKGEMLNPSISQSVTGSHNTAVAGNGNQVNTSTLIEELAAQRRLTEKVQMQLDKSQEQIDRLLTLLERK